MTVTESRMMAYLMDTIECALSPRRRLAHFTGSLTPAKGYPL